MFEGPGHCCNAGAQCMVYSAQWETRSGLRGTGTHLAVVEHEGRDSDGGGVEGDVPCKMRRLHGGAAAATERSADKGDGGEGGVGG